MAYDSNTTANSAGFRIIVEAITATTTTIIRFVRHVADIILAFFEPVVRATLSPPALAVVARLQALRLRRAWLLAWRLPMVPLVRLPERTRVCAVSSRYAVAYW